MFECFVLLFKLPNKTLERVMLFTNDLKDRVYLQFEFQGTIDVWWLYDDGGLTLLLPYILTTKPQWQGCKLRVFALANRKDELDLEQRNMANLMAKFRIEYSDMVIIPDMAKKAQDSSKSEFDAMINDFKVSDNESINKEDEGIVINGLIGKNWLINICFRRYSHQRSRTSRSKGKD